MKVLDIYIDGASKGNPGPAAVGVVICCKGQVIKNISDYIGEATNNIAEYKALIYALEEALILKADILNIRTDSELLFKQINGDYKVKNENIKVLYDRAKHLISAFKEFSISHISRNLNKGADKLANLVFKKKKKA